MKLILVLIMVVGFISGVLAAEISRDEKYQLPHDFSWRNSGCASGDDTVADNMAIKNEAFMTNQIIFQGERGESILRFDKVSGEVFYRDRLLTTDKEIVDGMRKFIRDFRCGECGVVMDAHPNNGCYHGKDAKWPGK